MIECEIKSMVSEEELLRYKHMLDGVASCKRKLQINYYFDTPEFINNSMGNTLRIRQTGTDLKLQYKYDKQYSGKEKICKEFEKKIDSFLTSIQSDILPKEAFGTIHTFGYIGNLVTDRMDYIIGGAIVSLDTNYYLGVCDHEIEIEFNNYDEAENVLEMLSLKRIETSEMGKYSRFVKRYQNK